MSDPSSPAPWYLTAKGKVAGPFSEEDVVAKLLARSVPPETLACPDGGQAWQPLSSWTVFSGVTSQLPPRTGHFPPVPGIKPARPRLEQALIVYAVIMNPLIWLLLHVTCLFRPVSFVPTSVFYEIDVLLNIGIDIGWLIPRAYVLFAGIKLLRNKATWPRTMNHGLRSLLVYALSSTLFVTVAEGMMSAGAGAEGYVHGTVADLLGGISVMVELAGVGVFLMCLYRLRESQLAAAPKEASLAR